MHIPILKKCKTMRLTNTKFEKFLPFSPKGGEFSLINSKIYKPIDSCSNDELATIVYSLLNSLKFYMYTNAKNDEFLLLVDRPYDSTCDTLNSQSFLMNYINNPDCGFPVEYLKINPEWFSNPKANAKNINHHFLGELLEWFLEQYNTKGNITEIQVSFVFSNHNNNVKSSNVWIHIYCRIPFITKNNESIPVVTEISTEQALLICTQLEDQHSCRFYENEITELVDFGQMMKKEIEKAVTVIVGLLAFHAQTEWQANCINGSCSYFQALHIQVKTNE